MSSAGHFQLHTLFANDWLDLFDISKHQRPLNILGVYVSTLHRMPLRCLLSPKNQPILVVGLSRFTYDPVYNSIVLVPKLDAQQPETLDALLRQAFRSDPMEIVKLKAEEVKSVTILLGEPLEEDSLQVFMRSASRVLEKVEKLHIHILSGEVTVSSLTALKDPNLIRAASGRDLKQERFGTTLCASGMEQDGRT